MLLRAVEGSRIDYDRLDKYPDRNFCQRRHWIDFVSATQAGKVVHAELTDSGQTVGHFSGLVVRRFGVRILGSPFVGWSTPFLGFNLIEGVSRTDALRALQAYAFRELGCMHIELCDPNITDADALEAGFELRPAKTFLSDLTESREALLSKMSGDRRGNIRKAERDGVRVEVAEPAGFADEYYAQLISVFAKQDMRPLYSLDRVRRLIECVHPSGDLLLLRAIDTKGGGASIATGIFAGYNSTAYFWGNASVREAQRLRPNEPLLWTAMQFWKDRGAERFYWGGGGDYKRKYGGVEIQVPRMLQSRLAFLSRMRDWARKLYSIPRNIKRAGFKRKLEERDGG